MIEEGGIQLRESEINNHAFFGVDVVQEVIWLDVSVEYA